MTAEQRFDHKFANRATYKDEILHAGEGAWRSIWCGLYENGTVVNPIFTGALTVCDNFIFHEKKR